MTATETRCQTAYQIQVRLGSSGTLAWDSGQVTSAEQSYLRYAGPALAAGESYSYAVRTWNRQDVASAWSASAGFDTALTNDAAGWRATWIRRTTTGADALDEYTLARVERTIGAGSIRRARAYVSANHQYELHLDGNIVDRGPAFAYLGEAYYQATDITSLRAAPSRWASSTTGTGPARVVPPGSLACWFVSSSIMTTARATSSSATGPGASSGRRSGRPAPPCAAPIRSITSSGSTCARIRRAGICRGSRPPAGRRRR